MLVSRKTNLAFLALAISSKIFSSNADALATAAVTARLDELSFHCNSNLVGEAYSETGKTSSNPGKVRELG